MFAVKLKYLLISFLPPGGRTCGRVLKLRPPVTVCVLIMDGVKSLVSPRGRTVLCSGQSDACTSRSTMPHISNFINITERFPAVQPRAFVSNELLVERTDKGRTMEDSVR